MPRESSQTQTVVDPSPRGATSGLGPRRLHDDKDGDCAVYTMACVASEKWPCLFHGLLEVEKKSPCAPSRVRDALCMPVYTADCPPVRGDVRCR
jgi:hypothetical protein